MKKLKKVLCFVFPLVLAAVAVLCVAIDGKGKGANADEIKPMAATSSYDGQVVTSDEDTGAKTSAKDYKGGAIFLEPNSTFTMSGGTITGHQNTYGGAIYVSNGATFTMTAGTISSNKATYGGAIYVEAGGKCYIRGGTITKNSVSAAGGAIFVETGGILEIDDSVVITDNDYPFGLEDLDISAEKEQMGGSDWFYQSSVYLYTTTFGSYPQTYVGNDMNVTLENWFAANSVAEEKTYTTRANDYNTTGTWSAYRYIDGELYVRERSYRHYIYTYKNGDSIPANGTYVWFKVEPIKWFIMNYDEWRNGSEKIELYSAILLTGNIPFNETEDQGNSWETSFIRNWCNETFYKEAFSSRERAVIALTTIKNNLSKDYESADSDGKANNTQDYIYLKSYYEIISGIFAGAFDDAGNGYVARMCAPSDFALSNYVYFYTGQSTSYRSGTSRYWLRSAGNSDSWGCLVDYGGIVSPTDSVSLSFYCIRPALRLTIAA